MPTTDRALTLSPRLVVADVDRAVAFYVAALGAREVFRFVEPTGAVAHCELTIGGHELTLAEANDDYRLLDPIGLGGSPVLIRLQVPDVDHVGEAMVEAGAQVIVPIEDRGYGRREGRLRDPAGHLWVLTQPLPDDDGAASRPGRPGRHLT